jgi:predicted MFS family arabinose efflux permease
MFDVPGVALYVGMTAAIMFGFSTFTASLASKLLIPMGFALGALFVARELKTPSPIVEVRLFAHNPSYALSNVATLLNYGATFALGYFMSVYLQTVKGFDSQTAGLILISQPAIMALLSPYAGRLSDRISPFRLASAGMSLCTASLLSFSFISPRYPMALIMANLVVIGVGFALFSSPNTNAIMSCVEARSHGVASSIIATMRTLGHTSSMAVITLVISARMGSSTFADAPTATLAATMRTGFAIFTCICATGVFFSLQRKAKDLDRRRASPPRGPRAD